MYIITCVQWIQWIVFGFDPEDFMMLIWSWKKFPKKRIQVDDLSLVQSNFSKKNMSISEAFWIDTLPKFNSSPLKKVTFPIGKKSSNHHFSGENLLLNFPGCVSLWDTTVTPRWAEVHIPPMLIFPLHVIVDGLGLWIPDQLECSFRNWDQFIPWGMFFLENWDHVKSYHTWIICIYQCSLNLGTKKPFFCPVSEEHNLNCNLSHIPKLLLRICKYIIYLTGWENSGRNPILFKSPSNKVLVSGGRIRLSPSPFSCRQHFKSGDKWATKKTKRPYFPVS